MLFLLLGCSPTGLQKEALYVENATTQTLQVWIGAESRRVEAGERTTFRRVPDCYVVKAVTVFGEESVQRICTRGPALVIFHRTSRAK